MCCDPIGSELPEAGVCQYCHEPVDEDGDTLEKCAYSPEICNMCGHAPCDQSC